MSALTELLERWCADGVPVEEIETRVADAIVAHAGEPGAREPHATADSAGDADREVLAGLVAAGGIDVLVATCQYLGRDGDGVVFTPAGVADFIADAGLDRLGADAIPGHIHDPAVGCGALLAGVMRRLHERGGHDPAAIVAAMSGNDIDSHAARRTALVLRVQSLLLGGDGTTGGLRITCGDALEATDAIAADLVVANPPYVRYQELDEPRRRDLEARWASCHSGNFNLYFAFFEHCHRICAPGGHWVAIAPNAWLRSAAGRGVRRWARQGATISHITDFDTHQLFDADTYVAVVVGGHSNTAGAVTYHRNATGDLTAPTTTTGALYDLAALGDAPWTLTNAGPGSGTHRAPQLRFADVADMSFGVATCRDNLYLLDGARDSDGMYLTAYDGVTYRIEAGLTRLCRKVSSLATDSEVRSDTRRIIYPYALRDNRAHILDEARLAARFPHGYRYLCAIRDELAQRDHGLKTYPAWYAYGRSQGLTPVGDSLLVPLYVKRARVLRDRNRSALCINGSTIALRKDAPAWVTLDLLAGVLATEALEDHLAGVANTIAGGYRSCGKRQLADFPILDVTPQLAIRSLNARREAIDERYADR